MEWQNTYSDLHRDILAGAVTQRFVVAVGVEQGLTGVSSISESYLGIDVDLPLLEIELSAGWHSETATRTCPDNLAV